MDEEKTFSIDDYKRSIKRLRIAESEINLVIDSLEELLKSYLRLDAEDTGDSLREELSSLHTNLVNCLLTAHKRLRGIKNLLANCEYQLAKLTITNLT